ncbi:MAG: hypothetical protein ACI9R3_001389 [Verrucomicrobiales bacterium]|jgi:hypothetical protein
MEVGYLSGPDLYGPFFHAKAPYLEDDVSL